MHKATHLEGEPEGGFFAKYSKLLGTGLAASLNAIGEIDLTMCKFENFYFNSDFTWNQFCNFANFSRQKLQKML